MHAVQKNSPGISVRNLLERWPAADRRSEEAYTALWAPVMERYREEERLYALTQENDLAGFLEVLAELYRTL